MFYLVSLQERTSISTLNLDIKQESLKDRLYTDKHAITHLIFQITEIANQLYPRAL